MSYKIFDMELDEDERLKLIQEHREFPEYLDIISRLCAIYEIAGTMLVRTFMKRIVLESNLHILLKVELVKSLCNYESNNEVGIALLEDKLPACNTTEIPLPNRVELCVMLMKYSKEFNEVAHNEFVKIIDDVNIDEKYRYKTILGLEQLEEKTYVMKCMELFLINTRNSMRNRILAGQYLFVNKSHVASDILLGIARDKSIEINTRADSADVLLQYGTEEVKEQAKEVIKELGSVDGPVRSLFDNAQNVHTIEIDESAQSILEKLHDRVRTTKTFEQVEGEIMKIIDDGKDGKDGKEGIILSLNRIKLDRAIYGKFSLSLQTILVMVWSYINGNETLITRLLEELTDTAGTCSSGYFTRIVNSLSGFEDFSIRISWRDQIIGNLNGRLNARARALDEPTQEKIFEEISITSCKFEDRPNFLKFFRENILSVRDEMYNEFKEYMDDTTFDLYFRQAISKYEDGQWN
jgi:hypothetical protein